MKKILFIITITILIVSGCKMNSPFSKKVTQPNSENKLETNNLTTTNQSNKDNSEINEKFNKKQECASYQDEIRQFLENQNDGIFLNILDEIFYSPKQNSCLYSYKAQPIVKDGIKKLGIHYYIVNYLTSETVASSNTFMTDTAFQYYEEMKQEYKE